MIFHQRLFWLLVFLLPTQIGRHFWPDWSYVFGLRVDYLAPTVYLTDLLIVGILASWWWQFKIQRSKLKIKNYAKRYWWVLVFFIYLLVNSLLAQNPGAALYKFVKIIEFTLLGLYVAKNQSSVLHLQSSLAGAVIYSSLIALGQFFKQASLGGVFWWLGERTFTVATPGIAKAVIGGRLLMRPYATFPHPNVLAGFVLVGLILIADFSLRKKRSRIDLGSNLARSGIGIRWLALILGAIAIAISFSRSTWLVGLLFLLPIAYYQRINKKSRMIISLLIFLGFVSLFYFAPQLSTEEAISQRVGLMKVATQMIRSSPLTGVGLNNFIVRLPDFWTVQSIYWLQPVHNLFLLVATEIGLVGLAVFIWFLILTFKKLLIPKESREASITKNQLLLLLLSVILVLGLFDHYWFTLQQSQLLLTIILGFSWVKH